MNKKKTDQAHDPPKGMPLDDMIHALASGLADAIEGADFNNLKEDPADAFIDLACRLIYKLSGKLTIVPVPNVAERTRIAQAEAAARTLDIFTRWMLEHPECSYVTRISASGKFQLVVKTPDGTKLFFGESIRDAYAQAAQAINFNGGTL